MSEYASSGYVASGLTGANVVYTPPPFPYLFPTDQFNNAIAQFGQQISWSKSHTCACINFRTDTSPAGSPNPSCLNCQGRGIYWDSPVNFIGLITFTQSMAGGIDPGSRMDSKLGPIIGGEPWVTITQDAGAVWNGCGQFDLIVELNSITRFNSTLSSGPSGVIYVPYQQQLYIAPSGAVTTWSQSTSSVVQVSGYVVSGATVTIPSSYPSNTPYVVEFQAANSFVCFRPQGGMSHNRPFVQGTMSYPKRFRLQPLDLFLRDGVLNNFGNPGQISS